MPIYYVTQSLRDTMQDHPHDHPNLIYHVRCPMDDEICDQANCRSGECSADDNTDGLECDVLIAAAPDDQDRHPEPHIDYEDDWTRAVCEAALLMDNDQLEELDDLQQQWLGDDDNRTARSRLVETLILLADAASSHAAQPCATCSHFHLTNTDDCPGCERLKDPNRVWHGEIYMAKPATPDADERTALSPA